MHSRFARIAEPLYTMADSVRGRANDRPAINTPHHATACPALVARSGYRILRTCASAAGISAGHRVSKRCIPGRLCQLRPHSVDEHASPDHEAGLDAPRCLRAEQSSYRLRCSARQHGRRTPPLNGHARHADGRDLLVLAFRNTPRLSALHARINRGNPKSDSCQGPWVVGVPQATVQPRHGRA